MIINRKESSISPEVGKDYLALCDDDELRLLHFGDDSKWHINEDKFGLTPISFYSWVPQAIVTSIEVVEINEI